MAVVSAGSKVLWSALLTPSTEARLLLFWVVLKELFLSPLAVKMI